MYRIIGTDGRQYGPATAEQLRQWLAENRINAQSQAQPEGATEWKPLGSFPEFADQIKPPPLPTVLVPGTAAARDGNKIPAGILGILLGSLGIHKFILGYTTAGVIMLLCSLVGWFFTCGISAIVMHIIGIIEGVIYLCKTDEEFVRTYVDNRREWF